MPIKCYSGQRLDPSFEDHASLIENLPEMNDVHDNNHNHDARDQSLFAPTCALADVRRIHLGRRPAGTATYFASLNIPMPSIAVWVSVVIHLLGGLGILIGFKTRWAAALLLLREIRAASPEGAEMPAPSCLMSCLGTTPRSSLKRR
jgi:hypothetical protein